MPYKYLIFEGTKYNRSLMETALLWKSPFVLGRIPKEHRLKNTNEEAKTSEKDHTSCNIAYLYNKNEKKIKYTYTPSLLFHSSSLLEATLPI